VSFGTGGVACKSGKQKVGNQELHRGRDGWCQRLPP
jgi:hypothetical protein